MKPLTNFVNTNDWIEAIKDLKLLAISEDFSPLLGAGFKLYIDEEPDTGLRHFLTKNYPISNDVNLVQD